jgi:hypothetical protein
MKGHVPCHHHEILPNSILTMEKSYLATTTFRPIPALGPIDSLPASADVAAPKVEWPVF